MRYNSAIFCIAAATLLLEISLSRVFSVLFFHHFAFLIVSTALFGFGFSGVFLFFRKPSEANLRHRLSLASLLFAASTLVVYKVILILPHGVREIMDQPVQVWRLVVNYALLIIPFFFSGYVIAALLSIFPERSGRLYCFDLIGASLGCIAVLYLVPVVGGSGAVVAAAILACIAALILAPARGVLFFASVAAIAGTGLLLRSSEAWFRLPITQIIAEKYGARHFKGSVPEYSGWSPVSRIDVYPAGAANKIMFLDGGSNVSFMIPFDGDVENLQPRINWRVVPYVIAPRPSACIIGPGGGEDVLNALSYRSQSIDAVEMDPLIVDLVLGIYSGLTGRIFHHPSVHTLNDEGRSYLRRSGRQFDLIQEVHNVSPMAIASGALNLSESYLLTVEAFQEYWDHLKPDGMLAINRWGVVRAGSIASVVLESRGIADPENYVLVTSRKKSGADTSFYLKKGRITQQDLQRLKDSLDSMRLQIDYAPAPEYQKEENIYYRLLVPSLRNQFLREADVVLYPPTDDRPFFDHFQRFGSFQKSRTEGLPKELDEAMKFVNMGDYALLTLLAEGALFSFLFIVLPLFRMRRQEGSISRWAVLTYFAALGFGFILIEISLIQKHILFLGQPVYSLSSVLFSILVSAGAGSFIFEKRFREGNERKWLLSILILLGMALFFEAVPAPKIFNFLLGASKPVRFLISWLMIAPLGLLLGIPFPLGIRILGRKNPDAIPWGWGLNAYTTVIGSILSVIFAITLGFRMNFMIAYLTYAAGLLAFFFALRRRLNSHPAQ